MIWEAEFADGAIFHAFLIVPHVLLGAQVVDFDHFAVMCLEEIDEILLVVSVVFSETCGWESARDNSIRNVGQIQVPLFRFQTSLLAGYQLLHGLHWITAAFLFL